MNMEELVDNAIKFGWVLEKRGVTVWVEENKSYIVNYDTEQIIHTINK
jgi:hypothetical protein